MLACWFGVVRSTITRAINEVRPLLAERGCTVRPDAWLQPLAEVVDHLGARGKTGIVDGTEIRVRRPTAGNPNAPEPNSMVVVAASAASAVATDGDGDGGILFQRRRDNDLWTLPGGGMDLTDFLPGTAVREVKEETDLDVEITGLVGTYTDPKHIMTHTDGEVRCELNACFTGGRVALSNESTELRFVRRKRSSSCRCTTPNGSDSGTFWNREAVPGVTDCGGFSWVSTMKPARASEWRLS